MPLLACLALLAASGDSSGTNVRLAAGANWGIGPGYRGVAWGVGLEAGAAFDVSRVSIRVLGNFTHVENPGASTTNLALVIGMATVWFDWYGLGVGVVTGVADVSRQGVGFTLGVLA